MVSFHTKELLNITAVIKKEKVIKKKKKITVCFACINTQLSLKKKIGKIGGVLGEDISRSS